jgi:hypothetical protein
MASMNSTTPLAPAESAAYESLLEDFDASIAGVAAMRLEDFDASALAAPAAFDAGGPSSLRTASDDSQMSAPDRDPPSASPTTEYDSDPTSPKKKIIPSRRPGQPPPAPAAPLKKKRGPGRPSTKPDPPSLDQRGVVSDPDDPANTIEFVYGNPDVFKSLFAYFKNIKAANIHVRFSPTAVTFFTRDNMKLTRVVAHIEGSRVNHYYCAETYWMGMTRDLFEKMFAQIDKTLYKISIIGKADDLDHLWFIFKDAEVDKECHYKMKLAKLEADPELVEAETLLTQEKLDKDYPISFTLSDKQFKKTVNDAANYTDLITFEQVGNQPFQLTYLRTNVAYFEIYRTPQKIRLLSTVSSHGIFRCSVRVDSIKSLAASMVTDEMRIMCREKDNMVFRSEFDAAVKDALVLSTIVPVAVV